jgi:hypothetical protein
MLANFHPMVSKISFRILPFGFMLMLIFSTISFESCQKSDDPVLNDTLSGDITNHDSIPGDTIPADTIHHDTIPADTLPISSQIMIGGTYRMHYFPEIKEVYGGENQVGRVYLDLNLDQNDDIAIEATHVVSMGTNYKFSRINPLHSDVSFFGIFTIDTTWVYADTIAWPSGNSYYVTSNSSCHPLSPYTGIYTRNAFHILDLNAGDSISREMSFSSEIISFITKVDSYVHFGNDTITQVNYTIIDDCYKMPSGPPFYLGFKIAKGEEILLGWLKLSLPAELRIRLYEWAVQKRQGE